MFWLNVFSALSYLFFTLNSAGFVGVGAKIFLFPGVWYPSYATEKIIRGRLSIVTLCKGVGRKISSGQRKRRPKNSKKD